MLTLLVHGGLVMEPSGRRVCLSSLCACVWCGGEGRGGEVGRRDHCLVKCEPVLIRMKSLFLLGCNANHTEATR